MKLRNKKTGEIVRVEFLNNYQTDDGTEIGFRVCNTTDVYSYNSLSELNEEWEDYKEPKEYYYIYADRVLKGECDGIIDIRFKEIGNYFETEEEAKQAVEKLKAWKRLKDYYVKFKLDFVRNTIHFTYRIDGTLHSAVNEERIIFEDMKTIFGGEDE